MKKRIYKIVVAVALALVVFASLLALTACKPKKKVFEKDTVFKSNTTSLPFAMGGMSLPLGLVATVTTAFRTDGTATVKIALANISGLGSFIDISAIAGLDIGWLFEEYVADFLPGATVADLPYSFDLLAKTARISIKGIDYESETFKKLQAQLALDGTVPADVDILSLAKGLSIEYDCYYHIEEVTSSVTGKTWTGIYCYIKENYGDPWLIFTVSTEEKTKKRRIDLNIEIIKLYWYMIEA